MASAVASDFGEQEEVSSVLDMSYDDKSGETWREVENSMLFGEGGDKEEEEEEEQMANDAARLVAGGPGAEFESEPSSESSKEDEDVDQSSEEYSTSSEEAENDSMVEGDDERQDVIIARLRRRLHNLQRKYHRQAKPKRPSKRELKKMLREYYGLSPAWAGFVSGKRRSKGGKKLYYTNKWEHHEIVKALVLRAKVGGRGYEYIRDHHLMPLPSRSCLRRHLKGFDVNVGIINSSMSLLKKHLEKAKEEHQTLTCVTYDEMYVETFVCLCFFALF